MVFKNSADQYGLISKLLHWSIAALMLILVGLGVWMVDLSYYDPCYHDALSTHKSLGIIVCILVLFKLVWKRLSPNPSPQSDLNEFERQASRWVHRLLLFAMIAIPLTGYLVSTSEGAAIEVFGIISVPALFQVNESLRDLSIEFHYYLAYVALAFILLHASAALKHQLIDGKGTLKRMW